MRRYFLIVLAVLAADQASKWWIVETMRLYEVREVIPGLFNLVHVTNKGAAFSLFASSGSPLLHYFFVAVNSLAAIALTVAAVKFRHHAWYVVSFALVAAGALGNLIDRLRVGAVIDFIDVYVGSYHWPAFNVADSSICVGVAVLFVLNFVEFNNRKQTE